MHFIFRVLTSLRLTVLLLGFSMLLVFFGTLDQVHYGVFEVQKRYFESFFAYWQYPQQWIGGEVLRWLIVPMPGGYLLGTFLVLNLLCAHFKYFVSSWKKIGIVLIHTGILVLIISGFLTSFWQKEAQMWIELGETSHYIQSIRDNELVIIDRSGEDWDDVYSVPASLLQNGKKICIDESPFCVQALDYFPNAALGLRSQNPEAPESPANAGAALKMGLIATPESVTYKDNELNTATAYVNIEANGESLGVWLVSNLIDERFPPQKFEYQGKSYELALRFKRTYLPFALKLMEFKRETYPGTEIPKSFSSKVEILDPEKEEDRQVLIYMNNPLRYKGYTFFQASYGNEGLSSMFQVVRNPSRLFPYIGVWLVGIGLVFHFLIKLTEYLRRQKAYA